jgi:hypothetical protein
MRTYSDACELAMMSARNSPLTGGAAPPPWTAILAGNLFRQAHYGTA